MAEKAVLVELSERRFRSFVIQAIMVVIGVGAFLLFIGKTLGTAQELSTGTIDPPDRASMERTGLAGIPDPAAPTQNGQVTAGPGQWLIEDVARERAEFELRQVNLS